MQLCEAVGFPELAERPFWKLEAEKGQFIEAWRKLGLSDEAILEVARAHAEEMPEPPQGPKGLDRAMARKANPDKGAPMAGRDRKRAKEHKYTAVGDRVAFWAERLKEGKYIAPNAISSTVRGALIAHGHFTDEDLRRRGV